MNADRCPECGFHRGYHSDDCAAIPPAPFGAGRWMKVCQDCWQVQFPDQYMPELTGYDTCSQCGQEALVVSVSPKEWTR